MESPTQPLPELKPVSETDRLLNVDVLEGLLCSVSCL